VGLFADCHVFLYNKRNENRKAEQAVAEYKDDLIELLYKTIEEKDAQIQELQKTIQELNITVADMLGWSLDDLIQQTIEALKTFED